MNIERKPIFLAVRQIRHGEGFTLEEVEILDRGIDEALATAGLAPAPAIVVIPSAEPSHIGHLANEPAFFEAMRTSKALGPSLSQEEVDGCKAIMSACGAGGFGLSWTAYALATAYHETAGTLRPIREYGRGKGKRYGVVGKHGQVAYGRGYVQLTWDENYERADKELGLGGRLISNYDLALEPRIAADIMISGMGYGWFSGKKLRDTLPAIGAATLAQFVASRPIINGRDKAEQIAGHALEFQRGLVAGGWSLS